MNRPLLPCLGLAAGLALAACSEPPQESTLQGPSTLANVLPAACNPNDFNSLINGYFEQNGNPSKDDVRAQKDAMLAELNETPADLDQARVHGFNILAAIALRSKAASPPPVLTGSTLAVEVLECTSLTGNDVMETVPTATFFTEELNRAAGGTFEVRGSLGDPGDPITPVQAAVNKVVIAGMAPPSGVTWNNALNNNRVLFYGDPATSSASDYIFSEVPRNLTFDPALLVTTCVADTDGTLMVTESGVGALAFAGGTSLDHIGCGAAPSLGATGRFDLLRHLAALGRELFLPEPAAATFALAVVGGSKKGQSTFNVKNVALNVTVSPTNFSTPLVVNQSTFSLTVTVKDKQNSAVQGSLLTLALEANNGTDNSVRFFDTVNRTCTGAIPSAVTGEDFNTEITFSPLCITKVGGVKVVALVDVLGRDVAGIAKTAKIKVIPR